MMNEAKLLDVWNGWNEPAYVRASFQSEKRTPSLNDGYFASLMRNQELSFFGRPSDVQLQRRFDPAY